MPLHQVDGHTAKLLKLYEFSPKSTVFVDLFQDFKAQYLYRVILFT